MSDAYRYVGYPPPEKYKEEESPSPLPSSGTSGTFGTEPNPARQMPVPEVPQVPEDGVPSACAPNPLEDSGDLEKICGAALGDVIEQEKLLLQFSDELDYIGMNIAIALSYVQDILPVTSRIFYLGFTGRKGSGKSTATSYCARVCFEGVKLEGTTYPALADACKHKKTLCLDEFDAQSVKCPDLEMIVRQGIDLDAHTFKMVPDGKGNWIRDDVPCGGMKFLNWKNPIDDALLQRILTIKMAPGASTRMIIANEAPERFTAPIRCWFAAQAAHAKKEWSPEKVRELIEDRSHVLEKRLDNLLKAVPRHIQKAFWMLIICEIFGWSFDDTIKHLIEKQPEDEAYEDYKELVAEIYAQRRELKNDDSSVILELVDFKRDMSQRIKDKGLYPLRNQGKLSWTSLRQECGFVDGLNEKKKGGTSGKRILIFDERVLKAIGIETSKQAKLDIPEGESQ